MTPIRTPLEALRYQMAVVALFLDLPETPLRTSPSDQQQARQWFDRGVPLALVETALLLGSLRRVTRPAQAPRLAAIRSLAYFQPVVEELLETPMPDGFCAYLRCKMRTYLRSQPGLPPDAPPLPDSPS
jgi:hypothetical protein